MAFIYFIKLQNFELHAWNIRYVYYIMPLILPELNYRTNLWMNVGFLSMMGHGLLKNVQRNAINGEHKRLEKSEVDCYLLCK